MECAGFQLLYHVPYLLAESLLKTHIFCLNPPMKMSLVLYVANPGMSCRGDDGPPLSSSIFLQLWMLQLEMVFLVACAFPCASLMPLDPTALPPTDTLGAHNFVCRCMALTHPHRFPPWSFLHQGGLPSVFSNSDSVVRLSFR